MLFYTQKLIEITLNISDITAHRNVSCPAVSHDIASLWIST